MRAFRFRWPSPAMCVALLALFVALGGGAGAIVREARHLVSGDRTIAKRSLSGNRLRNNTLTGRQINEGKLGPVPSARKATSATNATNATNAVNAANAARATSADSATRAAAATRADSSGNSDTVGGLVVKKFAMRAAPNAALAQVFSKDGLTISGGCDGSGNLNGSVAITGGHILSGQVVDSTGSATVSLGGAGSTNMNPASQGSGAGTLTFQASGGEVMTVSYGFGGNFGQPGCAMSGTVTGG